MLVTCTWALQRLIARLSVLVILSTVSEDGRQDFDRTILNVTIPPTERSVTVFIAFNDDEINEASEGFFIVMTVSDLNLERDVEFLPDGNVTLIRIDDDDGR